MLKGILVLSSALPFLLLTLAALPLPVLAGTAEAAAPLDDRIAEELSAASRDAGRDGFAKRLRAILQAEPQQRQAILRRAMALRPDWAAALLSQALGEERGSSNSPAAPPAAKAAIPAEPKPAFSGSLDFGGILRTGNTENGGVKGQLKLAYKSDRWQHKGKAEAGYLKSRTDTLEQKFELEYETNYDIREDLFAFGLANYSDDRFSGFDYEILTAAGLGLRLFDDEPLKWEVTAGPSLRYAERADSDERETAPGARLTNDITWRISDNAFIGNETEILWDRERVTIDNDTSLKMRIVEQLSGKLSFNTRYRSNLPDDTENTDTTTRASIVYDF